MIISIVYFAASVSLILLACVFLASGVSKIFARQQFTSTLQQLNLISNSFIHPLSVTLPILEIAVAIVIFWGNMRIGILTGTILLSIFIGVTGVAIRNGRTNVECSCFGPFSHQAFGPEIIVQNTALLILGIFVLVISFISPGGLSLGMSNRIDLPILFPALAIFPIYALSKHFLTNRRYYQKDPTRLPVLDPAEIAASDPKHPGHVHVVEGVQQ